MQANTGLSESITACNPSLHIRGIWTAVLAWQHILAMHGFSFSSFYVWGGGGWGRWGGEDEGWTWSLIKDVAPHCHTWTDIWSNNPSPMPPTPRPPWCLKEEAGVLPRTLGAPPQWGVSVCRGFDHVRGGLWWGEGCNVTQNVMSGTRGLRRWQPKPETATAAENWSPEFSSETVPATTPAEN